MITLKHCKTILSFWQSKPAKLNCLSRSQRFNPLDWTLLDLKPERLTDIRSWHEHIPFAFVLIEMLKPRLLVELGTHKGDSYLAFCQAIKAIGLHCQCLAIDTWQGDPQAGTYAPEEVLPELKAFHDARYQTFSLLWQTTFDQARPWFAEHSIDLLHIDGLHTYDAVCHDFETWKDAVSNRGIILFHDIMVQDKNFGVWKFWSEIKHSFPHLEFSHGHGLGVLQMGPDVPWPVAVLFKAREEEKQALARFFALLGSQVTLQKELEDGRS